MSEKSCDSHMTVDNSCVRWCDREHVTWRSVTLGYVKWVNLGGFWELYVPAIIYRSVIWGWVLTCDNTYSWRRYSAAPPGDQVTGTMTWRATQSDCNDTEPSSPCPTLTMLSTRLESDKYKYLSHWIDSTRLQSHGFDSDDRPPRGPDVWLILRQRYEVTMSVHCHKTIQVLIGPRCKTPSTDRIHHHQPPPRT